METTKKTADKSTYYKNYREKNNQRLKNYDRITYYKSKYNLTNDFIEKYGDYSADVFKIVHAFQQLKNNNSEIATSLLTFLNSLEEISL